MHKRAAFRAAAGLTCLLTAATAVATPPVGPASAPKSPEFMLYMSWPLGARGRGSKLPNLSLRVGQARLGGNSGNPSAGDPMQHREIFRMEVFGRQDEPALGMRLGLGGRVTYDLHRGVFGFRADGWRRPSALQLPTPAGNLIDFEQKRSLSPYVEIGAHGRDALSGIHEPSKLAHNVKASVSPPR
jgi:hypothetical protein